MKIYTGNIYGEDLARAKEMGLGIMIASTASNWKPIKAYHEISCALDNGAFQCWRLGYPFMERFFWQALEKCYSMALNLDFIVIPDLVAQGAVSLPFSIRYRDEQLRGCQRLALSVQDGMSETSVESNLDASITHIFVGGSVGWKWKTARNWVRFAHEKGLKCHIGRCGTLEALDRAAEIGADSVDSVNFARNGSWDVIRRYMKGPHPLFEAPAAPEGTKAIA